MLVLFTDMSLSSDNAILPCSESFWEIDGYQRVVKRTENGAQMCSELSKMILDRAEIERDYAKRLKAWSSKWAESLENGKYCYSCVSLHVLLRSMFTNQLYLITGVYCVG